MKHVLFVDDDPRMAEGLKRMLRPLRHEWSVDFAIDGCDALQRLSEAQYDVIVAGVQLPDMDGYTLLTEAIRISPQTVRILLCGAGDVDLILRSVSLAHQYLVKPCDANAIQATLEKALAIRSILDEPALVSLIGRIKSLPSPPTIYYRLMHAVLSENSSAAEVGSIISQDLSMSAKILQLVNSPLFAPTRMIANPEQAVIYLGIDAVRALAVTESIFCQFGTGNYPGFSTEELRDHSFQVASIARLIAKQRRLAPQFVSDIYMGGLMHDIGKLVLGSNFRSEYRQVVRCFGDSDALRDTERQLFGTTHAEVGAYLLWLWGMPASISGIVARHHPSGPEAPNAAEPSSVVHLADRIVRGGESAPKTEDLARIGLSPALLQHPDFAA